MGKIYVISLKEFSIPKKNFGSWVLNSRPVLTRQVFYHLSHTPQPFFALVVF
jgi:hypothetical protein